MPLAVITLVRRKVGRPGNRGKYKHPQTWKNPAIACTPFVVLLLMIMIMMTFHFIFCTLLRLLRPECGDPTLFRNVGIYLQMYIA